MKINTTTTKRQPPKNISAEAQQLWRRILTETEMDEPGLLLLNTVVESFDRMREAQALVREHGIVLQEKTAAGSVKHRTNPACQVERDAKSSMLRAWKLLGFDQAVPGSMGK